MASKRKTTAAIRGNAPKRIASQVSISQNLGNSTNEQYIDDDSAATIDEKEQDVHKVIDKFSASTYGRRTDASHDPTSHLFRDRDHIHLTLKPDHADLPLLIDPEKGRIILESFSPHFKEAESLLTKIAELQSRMSHIHEYTLTVHSLFTATSVGLTTEEIIYDLDSFSKTPIPASIKAFIETLTNSFGLRLVTKHTKYWIESDNHAVLQTLLRDEVISRLRIRDAEVNTKTGPKLGTLVISDTTMAACGKQAIPTDRQKGAKDNTLNDASKAAENMKSRLLEGDNHGPLDQVHSFEITPESVQEVSKRCRTIYLPLTEEYDFRNDEGNANLVINLKPATQIRHYQKKALRKMFCNGRARSGIIVLPHGSGKTLVGITASCTVKKDAIVLCTSAIFAVQWQAEFLKWSDVNPDNIAVYTSDHKDRFSDKTRIIISTYLTVTQSRGQSSDSQKSMAFIKNREWGLMILDDVHIVPAEVFRNVTFKFKSHAKLGLTAALPRESDKIQTLSFLIGPKLFEASWQEFGEASNNAKVQCAEVWCLMTTEFYGEYLKASASNIRVLLSAMNPRKFQACQFLIDYHESRGDKVIVFSDNVYALQSYAVKLRRPCIHDATPQQERFRILENFHYNEMINTIFLSNIGDTSFDFPEATCLIQISSHYGSRCQEAKRLGRILRAKKPNEKGFSAFFYSLVSKDTQEMYYSSKRQAFLVDQGYSFKVITSFQGLNELNGLAFTTIQERRKLLSDIFLQNETAAETEMINSDFFSILGR